MRRRLDETPKRITFVDDVITRGATQLACASRISEAYPKAEVRAFALVRTQSDGEINAMLDPVVGKITLRVRGGTKRDP